MNTRPPRISKVSPGSATIRFIRRAELMSLRLKNTISPRSGGENAYDVRRPRTAEFSGTTGRIEPDGTRAFTIMKKFIRNAATRAESGIKSHFRAAPPSGFFFFFMELLLRGLSADVKRLFQDLDLLALFGKQTAKLSVFSEKSAFASDFIVLVRGSFRNFDIVVNVGDGTCAFGICACRRCGKSRIRGGYGGSVRRLCCRGGASLLSYSPPSSIS